MCYYIVFFFKQKTAYEMRISDWSSDVCSSDLPCQHPSNQWPARSGCSPLTHFAIVGVRLKSRAEFRDMRHVRCNAAVDAQQLCSDETRVIRRKIDRCVCDVVRPAEIRRTLVLRSDELTSEIKKLMRLSNPVFCLKQKNQVSRP